MASTMSKQPSPLLRAATRTIIAAASGPAATLADVAIQVTLQNRAHGRQHSLRNAGGGDVASALQIISRQSHRYRLIYSGGLLVVGAFIFGGCQVVGVTQGALTAWDNDSPPIFLLSLIHI